MRRPRPRTESMSSLCSSSKKLFLSSNCSSTVVLNDGTGFKAIKSQNGEKNASVSCHLPRNSSDIGMVLISGTF